MHAMLYNSIQLLDYVDLCQLPAVLAAPTSWKICSSLLLYVAECFLSNLDDLLCFVVDVAAAAVLAWLATA